MDAKERLGIGVLDAVRIDEEIADAGRRQDLFQARIEGALGHPEPARRLAEQAFVLLNGGEHLGLDRGRLRIEHRQVAVGAGTGDQLEVALVAVFLEHRQQARAAAFEEDLPGLVEQAFVHPGQEIDVGPVPGALAFFLGERDRQVEVPGAPVAQQRVFHHVGQGRRDGQGDLEGCVLGPELVEELDQRNVGFGDRLEEPALFKKAIIFRMPHVGQMSVQDQ